MKLLKIMALAATALTVISTSALAQQTLTMWSR